MLTLLSPAKKLLTEFKLFAGHGSEPVLLQKAQDLVRLMKSKSAEEIRHLMDLSVDLAALNFQRYQDFSLDRNSEIKSYPALYLFQGDVYQGLAAAQWDKKAVDFSQSHLGILSGLYGILKPLDLIQPYRLEMGVHLTNPDGKNLYDFWGDLITNVLNQQLAAQDNPVLINLASQEYFKSVHENQINYPVVTINFYENTQGRLKMIGVYAKKARGTMARFLMQNQIDDLNGLKQFTDLGYQFSKESSSATHLDFIRTQ